MAAQIWYASSTDFLAQVMRVTLPGDLNSDELYAAANATAHSPVETFVALEEGEAAGYLEMDLRPDRRYLYWTVPGIESEPDGKVKQVSCVTL